MRKESKEVGECQEKDLRNQVLLRREAQGSLVPTLLMAIFWIISFSQRNHGYFRYPTLRISLNLGSVPLLLLRELQGLQMGWNE